MQFVVVTSSFGKIHGFIRHGEGTKFDLTMRKVPDVYELWFLAEPRRKTSGSSSYWSLVWYRRRTTNEIVTDTVSVQPLSYFI